MQVLKFEKDSVLIKHRDIKAWVDVWIEKGDVICDWNQNDFTLTDEKDVQLQNWQNNIDNFEVAISLAVSTLEKAGIIHQDQSGKWHSNVQPK